MMIFQNQKNPLQQTTTRQRRNDPYDVNQDQPLPKQNIFYPQGPRFISTTTNQQREKAWSQVIPTKRTSVGAQDCVCVWDGKKSALEPFNLFKFFSTTMPHCILWPVFSITTKAAMHWERDLLFCTAERMNDWLLEASQERGEERHLLLVALALPACKSEREELTSLSRLSSTSDTNTFFSLLLCLLFFFLLLREYLFDSLVSLLSHFFIGGLERRGSDRTNSRGTKRAAIQPGTTGEEGSCVPGWNYHHP